MARAPSSKPTPPAPRARRSSAPRAWADLIERLEDAGRWQKPVFYAALALTPVLIGAAAYSLTREQANNTFVYLLSDGLERTLDKEVSSMPAGRDMKILVCNVPDGSRVQVEVNGQRFSFDRQVEYVGLSCGMAHVVTPNLKGEVIGSEIPGRLVALRKLREAIGPSGEGAPMQWKVVDTARDRVLASGTVATDGSKPLKRPETPRVRFAGNWLGGRTLELVNYWSLSGDAQASFYRSDAAIQTIFVPRNPQLESKPFELSPNGTTMIADWKRDPVCAPTEGTLYDFIKDGPSTIRVLNIQPITLPAIKADECR